MIQSTSKSSSTLKSIGSERLFLHTFHPSLMKMMKKDTFQKEKRNLEDYKLQLNLIKHSLQHQKIRPMISLNRKNKRFHRKSKKKRNSLTFQKV